MKNVITLTAFLNRNNFPVNYLQQENTHEENKRRQRAHRSQFEGALHKRNTTDTDTPTCALKITYWKLLTKRNTQSHFFLGDSFFTACIK